MVLGLTEDGVCTDFVENLSVNSLKQNLSIDTTYEYNPPLFSLDNTFKRIIDFYIHTCLPSRPIGRYWIIMWDET
jgi:hypothetical protein